VVLAFNTPLIVNTARGNLMQLFTFWPDRPKAKYYLLTAAVMLPSLVISFILSDVDFLVSITGSFAGIFIEFVIPAFLVWGGRQATAVAGVNAAKNPFKCLLSAKVWIFFIWAWCVFAFVANLLDLVVGE
ncbi:hypothetical protein KIPB_008188, partial [Kipferlia bialata]